MIRPEKFLCNLAATGVSLFAREHAKDIALQSHYYVIITKVSAPKHFFCKGILGINSAAMVRCANRLTLAFALHFPAFERVRSTCSLTSFYAMFLAR